MKLERGIRLKLEDYLNINQPIQIKLSTEGNSEYDLCCFGVDSNDKLSDDRYMVFYNQVSSPNREITYSAQGNVGEYTVLLSTLPMNVAKLVFTVSIDGNGTMSQIRSHTIDIIQNGKKLLQFSLSGNDFQNEKAIIGIELYKKTVWRLAVVARGFNGGLGDLLKSYGGEIAGTSSEPPVSAAKTSQVPVSAQSSVNKPIELRKGEKINLEKKSSSSGFDEIIVNLNWSQSKGLNGANAVDLDLECLYELKGWQGKKGAVQAIGHHFGSLYSEPYIALDGDDRIGTSKNGENIRINSSKISNIKRVLIYTSIYEGAVNWTVAKGVVTIRCPGNSDIIIKLDEGNSRYRICAIAMLENNGSSGFRIEKLERYFESKPQMDRAYGWGLSWGRGSK